MKIKLLMVIIGLLIYSISFGQNQEKYKAYVKEAWSLYDSKEFKKSAEKYKEAFDQLDGKAYPNDRYNAACSYALAEDIENSFYHLFYLAENQKIKYRKLGHITTDADLNILHADERWDKLILIVKANKQEFEKDLDLPLVATLDSIYQLDQGYRREVRAIREKYGQDSEEMIAQWKLINHADSVNLIKITKILDERGWLGSKVIGNQGNSTLFLVIQHADLKTQVKYLPMMRDAVEKGNARASSLALLEDRVALRQGKRQIYGSQVSSDPETGEYYVLPLVEPEKVNERRAEVGLGKIEDYISNWNMTWDVEKHKERTKKAEEGK